MLSYKLTNIFYGLDNRITLYLDYLVSTRSRTLYEYYRIRKNWSKVQNQGLNTSKTEPTKTCKTYICENCGRSYMSKLRVEIHMKSECTNVKPFKCSLCLSKFSEKIALRRHFYHKHKIYVPPKNFVPKKMFH